MEKLTVKQEAFCYAYIENGGNASAAYREAYDAENMTADAVKVEASRLINSPNVALTVKSLRQAIEEANKLSIGDLIKELEEARIAALTAETVQAGAAVSATMGKAKMLGYDKQLIEHTGKNGGPIQTSAMPPDEAYKAMLNGGVSGNDA